MDFIEEYVDLLDKTKELEKSLVEDYNESIEMIEAEISSIIKRKNSYIKNYDSIKVKMKEEEKEKIMKLKNSNLLKKVEEYKERIEKLKKEKQGTLENVSKEDIKLKILEEKEQLGIFLGRVEEIEKEYVDKIPKIVKESVDIYDDYTEIEVEEFNLEESDNMLETLKSTLEYRINELNTSKIDNIINTVFIIKPDYLDGLAGAVSSIWYIFIMLIFVTFSIILVPAYVAFIVYIGIISYISEVDIRNSYKTILALKGIAKSYIEDVDKDVEEKYNTAIEEIENEYNHRIHQVDLLIRENERKKSKFEEEALREVEDKGMLKGIEERMKKDINAFENTVKENEERIKKLKEEKGMTESELEYNKGLLEEKRQRLFDFISGETRLYQSIYMNGFLMGFKEDKETPVYLKHNKRCSLLFYDIEEKNNLINFVKSVYYNSLTYMKDGECFIDLIDVLHNGIHFSDLLPTKDVFDNDAEKVSNYVMKLHNNLGVYYKFLTKDIEDRTNLMPRSGVNNIDDYNICKLKQKSSVMPYRIPLFYSFPEGVLTDSNMRYLINITGENALDVKDKNIGVIPLICIPYQYFFKESFEVILKYIGIVGDDNIFAIKDGDLLKYNEKQLAEVIGVYREDYEEHMRDLGLN